MAWCIGNYSTKTMTLLSTRIWREAGREAASISKTPFSVMFSHSLGCGTFSGNVPENWSLALITPIFKGCWHSEPSYYMPVARLSLTPNIIGSLICDCLRDYSLSTEFIPLRFQKRPFFHNQPADRGGQMDNHPWTQGEGCRHKHWPTKAFNGVNHISLINNPKRLGVKSPSIGGPTSHLNKRIFKVRFNLIFYQAIK